jgi:hypothetical protein
MTITLYATFDGEVLRPEEPIPLAPNTRVRLVIDAAPSEAVARYSFLRTAQALDLDGPPGWSSQLKAYLYGGQELRRNGAAE